MWGRFCSWYNGLSPLLVKKVYFFAGGMAWGHVAYNYLGIDLGETIVVALIAAVFANWLEERA